jgi:hypothetical protein
MSPAQFPVKSQGKVIRKAGLVDRKFSRSKGKEALNETMRKQAWLILLLATAFPAAAAEPQKYLELNKSSPVAVNGLEFVAAVQSQCLVNTGGKELPVEVQLLITNRSGHDLVFRTFDTFGVVLKDAGEKELPEHGGRDGTIATLSVLIHAGDTYCLSRKAELWWKLGGFGSFNKQNQQTTLGWTPDNTRSSFFYWDGTGMETYFTPMKPGRYALSFRIVSSEKDSARETQKLGGLPVWAGDTTTREASFEIVENP